MHLHPDPVGAVGPILSGQTAAKRPAAATPDRSALADARTALLTFPPSAAVPSGAVRPHVRPTRPFDFLQAKPSRAVSAPSICFSLQDAKALCVHKAPGRVKARHSARTARSVVSLLAGLPSAASLRDQNHRRHPKGNPPSPALRRRRPSRSGRRDTTARGAREQNRGARDTRFSTQPKQKEPHRRLLSARFRADLPR